MNSDDIQRFGLIAGGTLLVIHGLRRRSPAAIAAAVIGAAAAAKGLASRSSESRLSNPERAVTIEKSVTINKPVEELYRSWRDLEPLTKDVEIEHVEENALISWRSLPDAEVQHSGSVHFGEKAEGRGTAVRVIMRYERAGKNVEKQLSEDLRRFKQLMEIGEIPATEGQPSGAVAPDKSKFIDVLRDRAEATT